MIEKDYKIVQASGLTRGKKRNKEVICIEEKKKKRIPVCDDQSVPTSVETMADSFIYDDALAAMLPSSQGKENQSHKTPPRPLVRRIYRN
jgi:hypothetical protein